MTIPILQIRTVVVREVKQLRGHLASKWLMSWDLNLVSALNYSTQPFEKGASLPGRTSTTGPTPAEPELSLQDWPEK